MPPRKNQIVFVIGTDTGIGKTAVACGLARMARKRGWNIGVMKPVATGCYMADGPETARRRGKSASKTLISEDALLLRASAGSTDPMAVINPVALSEPLSPHMAARLAGQRLTPASVRRVVSRCLIALCRHRDLVIVEGVGGILVPIADRWTFGDLLAELNRSDAFAACRIRVLLVAVDRLGTINHTLLTLEAAKRRGVDISAVILNRPQPPDYASRTNLEALRLAASVPIFGPLPRLRSASDEEMADALEACGLAHGLGWHRRGSRSKYSSHK